MDWHYEIGDKVVAVHEMPWIDGWHPGREYEVISTQYEGIYGQQILLDGVSGWIHNSHVKRAQPASPIRTVTRREIVPGEYGPVRLYDDHSANVDCLHDASTARAAARIFNEIANVLDEQKEAA